MYMYVYTYVYMYIMYMYMYMYMHILITIISSDSEKVRPKGWDELLEFMSSAAEPETRLQYACNMI